MNDSAIVHSHCFLVFVSLSMLIQLTATPMIIGEISVADFEPDKKRIAFSSFIKFSSVG